MNDDQQKTNETIGSVIEGITEFSVEIIFEILGNLVAGIFEAL
jgi:hypothetical protein